MKCPECGKEISSEAPACPTCGHPKLKGLNVRRGVRRLFFFSWALWAALVLVVWPVRESSRLVTAREELVNARMTVFHESFEKAWAETGKAYSNVAPLKKVYQENLIFLVLGAFLFPPLIYAVLWGVLRTGRWLVHGFKQ